MPKDSDLADDGTVRFCQNHFHNGTLGTSYASGDTVGVGINFSTKAVFYTKNGEFLGKPIQLCALTRCKREWLQKCERWSSLVSSNWISSECFDQSQLGRPCLCVWPPQIFARLHTNKCNHLWDTRLRQYLQGESLWDQFWMKQPVNVLTTTQLNELEWNEGTAYTTIGKLPQEG